MEAPPVHLLSVNQKKDVSFVIEAVRARYVLPVSRTPRLRGNVAALNRRADAGAGEHLHYLPYLPHPHKTCRPSRRSLRGRVTDNEVSASPTDAAARLVYFS